MHLPKLIVFDLDGTLIDPQVDHLIRAARAILPSLHYSDLEESELRTRQRQATLFSIFPEQDRLRLMKEFWIKYFDFEEPPAAVIPGALEAVEHCVRAGCQVAIATSRPHSDRYLSEFLEESGLLNHITVLSSWWQQLRLDKVEQLVSLAEQFEINPRYAAMVGDQPYDVLSARKAQFGLSVAVMTGGIEPAVLRDARPDYLLKSLAALPEYISVRRNSFSQAHI